MVDWRVVELKETLEKILHHMGVCDPENLIYDLRIDVLVLYTPKKADKDLQYAIYVSGVGAPIDGLDFVLDKVLEDGH